VIEKQRNILLYALLAVALAVMILDRTAQTHYFYWMYWWYDIMMHFLGGFLVAGIALWVFVRFSKGDARDARRAFYVAIATGIVVGILWEYFEFIFKLPQPGVTNIVADTTLDLVMDIIGASAVWIVLRKMFFSKHTHEPPTV
jgi:hypothetical protein